MEETELVCILSRMVAPLLIIYAVLMFVDLLYSFRHQVVPLSKVRESSKIEVAQEKLPLFYVAVVRTKLVDLLADCKQHVLLC